MSTGQLFEVGPGDVALTSDDWYTPRWIFDAAELTFDMDVCAPVNPAFRTCPAREYLTVVEDGLVQPWHGLVWMNPPYSKPTEWIDKFAAHPSGLVLTLAVRSRAIGRLLAAVEAMTLIDLRFMRPDGLESGATAPLILASRGQLATKALGSMAAAADRAWFARAKVG